MTVQDFINKFNEIENKDQEIRFVNPYNSFQTVSIDNICLTCIDNKIIFDFETFSNFSNKNLL